MDSLSDRFRANVVRELESRNRSQGWLARQLRMHPTTVNHTLANPRHIGVTLGTVTRYAAVLGVDPLELLANPDNRRGRGAATNDAPAADDPSRKEPIPSWSH